MDTTQQQDSYGKPGRGRIINAKRNAAAAAVKLCSPITQCLHVLLPNKRRDRWIMVGGGGGGDRGGEREKATES